MLVAWVATFAKIDVSYYDPRTLYSGSGEPLSAVKPPRNLLRTGWGPRGDSGPERGRVRATQPAKFPLPSVRKIASLSLSFSSSRPNLLSSLPCEDSTKPVESGAGVSGRACLVPPIGARRATRSAVARRRGIKAPPNQYVGQGLRVHNDRMVRQVKGARDNWGAARTILLAAATLYPAAADFAQGAEPEPAKLHANTLEAFDRYVKLTEARNAEELKQGTNLFWIDELPAAERAEAYAALKRGEVQMKKLEMRDGGKEIACPAGLIHHWAGVVFIPGAKLDDVLGMLEDYDHHSVYYGPDVERSKIESRDGDHFRVFLRFRRHKVITVVLNTEHDIQYFHDGPGRAHSRSSAVRIAEVDNAGKSDEREKTPGEDGGFLWRMETWWRMEERDGGVYVQSEVASLTRDIPALLSWMIKPFVTSVPKETLTATLVATRKAVQARLAKH